jgi:hypothetical protein
MSLNTIFFRRRIVKKIDLAKDEPRKESDGKESDE